MNDLHDILIIRGALAQATNKVRGELSLLMIAKERDLEYWERSMLPHNLQGGWVNDLFIKSTREELIKQIDPWISYVDRHECLLKDYTELVNQEIENEINPPSSRV